VALNPIIKFSTLFGLLAVEIAVGIRRAALAGTGTDYTAYVGVVMLAIALAFVWRSFYAMRIPKEENGRPAAPRHEAAEARPPVATH
jgi:K(+)-stimulated pyrophosphate-energized sodium pump